MSATSLVLIPRPLAFWCGVVICTLGVVEHVVEFARAAPHDFRMAHMQMGLPMWAAMVAIVVGLLIAGYGLVPRRETGGRSGPPAGVAAEPAPGTAPVSDQRRTRARHRLVAVLAFALAVDQMKPATLAFMLPGMRSEYGITAAEVAMLPTGALAGTVLGSLLWGFLADRIGRRAAVLLAALLFVATTVCGAMPLFWASVLMCFMMGMSAGGMLPIVFTLMAEVFPGRSVVLVLQAGLTTVLGYLAASGLAALFVPLAGWRILWFLQLPLALALLLMNRWIPESPSFLVLQGRVRQAHRTADLFGLTEIHTHHTGRGMGALFGHGCRTQTLIICGYGLSWGVIYWGFLTFIPIVLGGAGLAGLASRLLFLASLMSIPGTLIGAMLYSRWSSRGTMALYGAVTTLSLAAFSVLPLREPVSVVVALIGLLTGTSGVIAVLGPYAAQVYPTAIRGLGSGLSAACTKAGGIFGPPLVASLLGVMPVGGVAIIVAIPMAAAATAVAMRGRRVAATTQLVAVALAPQPLDSAGRADTEQSSGVSAGSTR